MSILLNQFPFFIKLMCALFKISTVDFVVWIFYRIYDIRGNIYDIFLIFFFKFMRILNVYRVCAWEQVKI